MQRLSQEPRFDEAAQRQIISLAAELQRYEQEGATLADLEARAREAGIDPKYLRMALGHVAPATSNPPINMPPAPVASNRSWYEDNELSLLSVGTFALVQVVSVISLVLGGFMVYPFAVIFALVMGLAFSRTTTHRLGAAAVLLGTTVGSVLIALTIHRMGLTYNLEYRWDRNVFAGMGVQFVALMLGFLVAAGARWLRTAHRPNPGA